VQRYMVRLVATIVAGSWATPVWSASLLIENASFEAPAVEPSGFGAVPLVAGWTEIDLDTLGSTNTGVFANTAAGSPDHVDNADGNQLAFIGSEQGNGLQQDLTATYEVGCDYRLSVAVGVSMRFPPSTEELVDTIELVLYYYDETESVVDITSATVQAAGLSTTRLQDFSVYLPTVGSDEAWAGKTIGVAIRATGMAGGFWTVDHVRLIESLPISIPLENPSFEAPTIDPNAFQALPFADGWIELDMDTLSSSNTGVFANTSVESWDHVVNADGLQLAFLGSESGNAFEQDLSAAYKVGCDYRLTVALGISSRFPPSAEVPLDSVALVLYYYDETESVNIVAQSFEATTLSPGQLQDVSVHVPGVHPDATWAGRTIGVAIRAGGMPGGFWIFDNVRLTESLPISIPIENRSFEAPAIDPNAFSALPFADGWIEHDMDSLSSSNTGVFANTSVESWDHVVNADGLQLAFLGSESGNAFEQDLSAAYKVGCNYRLTVALGISSRFPPSTEVPPDRVELVLYYHDEAESVDVVAQAFDGISLSPGQLQDVSVYVPGVHSDDAWAERAIGIAIRAGGMPGGFWILDHVRLAESLPVMDYTHK